MASQRTLVQNQRISCGPSHQRKNCHRWHNECGKSSAVTNRYHSTSDACRYDGNDHCVQREGMNLIFLGCSCSLSVLIVNGILYLTLDGKIRKNFVRFITTCLFNSYYKTERPVDCMHK